MDAVPTVSVPRLASDPSRTVSYDAVLRAMIGINNQCQPIGVESTLAVVYDNLVSLAWRMGNEMRSYSLSPPILRGVFLVVMVISPQLVNGVSICIDPLDYCCVVLVLSVSLLDQRRFPFLNLGCDLSPVLDFGNAQIVFRLKVQPEGRRSAEVPSQTQRSIGGHGAATGQDLAQACLRDVQDLGQGVGRQAERLHELLAEDGAGVDRRAAVAAGGDFFVLHGCQLGRAARWAGNPGG